MNDEERLDEDSEWFTLDEIELLEDDDEDLVCLSVDSPDHEFLVGRMGVPTHNTDDAKAAQALKGEAASKIGSIARLGRAAGVHLMIATQRADAKLVSGELKSNLGARFACGQMQSIASSMVLENNDAAKTPGYPKGRAIIKIYGAQERMQVYFAQPSWIDEWLERRGLNKNGTPISPTSIPGLEGATPDQPDSIDLNAMLSQDHEPEGASGNDHDSGFQVNDDDEDGTPVFQVDDRTRSEIGDNLSDKLNALGNAKHTTSNSNPESEWGDYGGFMDEFKNNGN